MTTGSNHLLRARLRSCPFQHIVTSDILEQSLERTWSYGLLENGTPEIDLYQGTNLFVPKALEINGTLAPANPWRVQKRFFPVIAVAIPKILMAGTILLLSAALTFAQSETKPPEQNKGAQKTEDPQKLFATQCGIDFEGAPLHIFIDSSKGWKEYRDIKLLPELISGADSEFIVRSDASGKHYVRTFHPGDDFDRYQDDCFGETGKLQSFHYELRTAWGWGYEENRTFNTSGKMVDKSSRFFDTRTEKTIQTPERTKEVPDAIKPEVHTEFLDMPFIPYLNE